MSARVAERMELVTEGGSTRCPTAPMIENPKPRVREMRRTEVLRTTNGRETTSCTNWSGYESGPRALGW